MFACPSKRLKALPQWQVLDPIVFSAKNTLDPQCTKISFCCFQWECEKHLDRPKKVALLKLFIKHHLEMASASLRISTETQALFYLKQAWYLTRILKEENPLWADEAVKFLEEIRREEAKIITEMQTNIRKFGSLNVLNLEEERDDAGEDLETLDDIQEGDDGEKAVDAKHMHQQVRSTKVKLKTLSRSFSNNYFQEEPLENMR